MKNLRTPRTLADSKFTTGYRSVQRPQAHGEVLKDILLAVSIGVALGYILVVTLAG